MFGAGRQLAGLQAAQALGDPAATAEKQGSTTASAQRASVDQRQAASGASPADLLPLLAAAAAAGGAGAEQAAAPGSVDGARLEVEAGQLPFAPCSTPSIAAALSASLPAGRAVRGARTPASSKAGGQQAGSWQTWIHYNGKQAFVGRLARQPAAVAADLVVVWQRHCLSPKVAQKAAARALNLPEAEYERDARLLNQLRQISSADQMKAFLAAVIPTDHTTHRPAQAPPQRQPARRRDRRQRGDGPSEAALDPAQAAPDLLPYLPAVLASLGMPLPITPPGLAPVRTLPPVEQPHIQRSQAAPVLSGTEAATPPRSDTSHSRRKQRAPERSRQPSGAFGSLLGPLPEGGPASRPSSASAAALPPAHGGAASHDQASSAEEQEDAASPDRRSPKRPRLLEGPGASPCGSCGTASLP